MPSTVLMQKMLMLPYLDWNWDPTTTCDSYFVLLAKYTYTQNFVMFSFSSPFGWNQQRLWLSKKSPKKAQQWRCTNTKALTSGVMWYSEFLVKFLVKLGSFIRLFWYYSIKRDYVNLVKFSHFCEKITSCECGSNFPPKGCFFRFSKIKFSLHPEKPGENQGVTIC